MRIFVFSMLMFACSFSFAEPCREVEALNVELNALKAEIDNFDATGQEELVAAFAKLQQASKKNKYQMKRYAIGFSNRPELKQSQQNRENIAQEMKNVAHEADCQTLREHAENLRSVIAAQWVEALAVVGADTQIYLVKKQSKPSGIQARSDMEKKLFCALLGLGFGIQKTVSMPSVDRKELLFSQGLGVMRGCLQKLEGTQ